MFVAEVLQYGKGQQGTGGLAAFIQQYFFLLVLLIVVPLIIVTYHLLFPNLNKIPATRTLRNAVETQRVQEDLKSQDRLDDSDGEELGKVEPVEAEVAAPDAIDLALRLLRPDERKMVEALLHAEGSMRQKDITHETGFSRVKTHRVLAKLIRRNVVESEKHYNTNRITLAPWILEGRSKQ